MVAGRPLKVVAEVRAPPPRGVVLAQGGREQGFAHVAERRCIQHPQFSAALRLVLPPSSRYNAPHPPMFEQEEDARREPDEIIAAIRALDEER